MKTLLWLSKIIVTLTVAITNVTATVEVDKPAPSFKLDDQFGKTWKLEDLEGRVVILVAATKGSSNQMGDWVQNLKPKYASQMKEEKVQILQLLDLHTIIGPVHGVARSRIRKETNNPLMIDFEATTAKAYDVSNERVVVVVIDKEGVVRSVQKTKYDKDAFTATTTCIDKALKATPHK